MNDTAAAHKGAARADAQVEELQERNRVDRELIRYLQDEAVADRKEIENLQAALVTARRIGAAIGVIMNVMKVTEEEAFATLSTLSQGRNRKLRDLADDIVFTGELGVS